MVAGNNVHAVGTQLILIYFLMTLFPIRMDVAERGEEIVSRYISRFIACSLKGPPVGIRRPLDTCGFSRRCNPTDEKSLSRVSPGTEIDLSDVPIDTYPISYIKVTLCRLKFLSAISNLH